MPRGPSREHESQTVNRASASKPALVAVTWEAVTALSACASAVIVLIAAVAAIYQIRHLRSGNQLQAVLRIYDVFNSAEMVAARRYCLEELPQILAGENAAAAIVGGTLDARLLLVGNFSNELGVLVIDGFLDERLVWPLVPVTARVWAIVEPIAKEWRARRADPVWADFEYIAALQDRITKQTHMDRYPAWFRARLSSSERERRA